jgi:hypothetical protein
MKEMSLPPAFCARLCSNAYNDLCIERCNPQRDMSAFEPKKGLTIENCGSFPEDDYLQRMTPAEQSKVSGFFLSKIVAHVQGREEQNEQIFEPPRRRWPPSRTIYQARSTETCTPDIKESPDSCEEGSGDSWSKPRTDL